MITAVCCCLWGPVGDGLLYLYSALTHNTFISVFDTFFKSLFNTLQLQLPSRTLTIDDLPGSIPEIQLQLILFPLWPLLIKRPPPPHSSKKQSLHRIAFNGIIGIMRTSRPFLIYRCNSQLIKSLYFSYICCNDTSGQVLYQFVAASNQFDLLLLVI